ncbi:acyl-[ACP]--phospholipid O-acyltransferase [Nitrosomonas eutropha]|uniref:Acyl-[acyl-carrier-protein]-phospholipid O-acyltransferase/long-chain-fatty-acid--[acyl-carrier-protein] ligase n=2 Tax=Nitrosomonas eutropha TaxID=916 RepID=A0ABX5M9J4_9PROT|nr:acyl-[ACP]--phospholipid O-acyltransferase [Nitrosomonas eutropha]ABI60674.1 AMP-dependent synthetase and ligase [Nitrosomonas eutropha C91]PXV80221.1 acyl-[acyl-carrier-protein]-phospholipid O-acyltransferase/long-chain-fatty-acid--[acyl-carrier-protein] ligase [Nitrosomonas eutropha]SEI90355.1 acyl-[acyl-carrier-protein]-phospholipid O-acyltransferase / long-chain-fatty-acid--[acyl-carrier-protein] ligase [Nitrosomonas eutropha]
MHSSQWKLLSSRRFLPFFVTQFLGAFNDNVFKNALVILITYAAMDNAGLSPQIMVTLAAGIFILPFFVFSALAGQLADKWDKARLIRYVKFVEIILMGGAATGFYLDSVLFLLGILFLMGAQSAFFGPLKYSILPDQLREDELIGGNALVSAGTFIAILLGTIIGGLLILAEQGGWIVSAIVISVALAGWLFSLFIPPVQPAAADTTVSWHLLQDTRTIIQQARQNSTVFHAILGISWFWLFGATFLSQFPTFAKEIIGGNEQVVTLFLTLFSVGIGIGALLCDKLLKGKVAATYVPLGVLGMTFFTVDLYFASVAVVPASDHEFIGALSFLESFAHWRILLDLLVISISGGLYIVPLYAIVQNYAEASQRSRAIAANNIMNALFMVVSALGISVMLALDFTVPEVFLTIALLNGLVAIYIAKLLPYELARSILHWVFHTFYRLKINGLEHYQQAGERVLIVANHLSFLDAALLSVCFPERLCFAINSDIARKWWVRPFLFLADTVTVDPINPLSTRLLIERVRNGDRVVIFPEGRMTMTGALMKIYEGPAMIADKVDAKLLPVSLSGPQYTPFSRLKGKVRIRWFPRITVTVMPPENFNLPDSIRGRRRRRTTGLKLYDIMATTVFQSNAMQQTLFQSLLDAAATHGGKHTIAEDVERHPLNYSQLITRSFILGAILRHRTHAQENVGIMLPNMVSNLICFFSLHAFGRVPAMLNFSASSRNLVMACRIAQIRTVITARKFIEAAKLSGQIDSLKAQQIHLIYLEDLPHQAHWWHKLMGLVAGWLPGMSYRLTDSRRDPDAPAVVLFTSGSEDTPKGVVLSHTNLQANRFQVSARIDFGPSDLVFNALPIFHSFGLTGGTLLPVLSGIRVFLYPSPLHYRIIPELIYDTNATLMFGTDTFLAGYARYANAYDFYSIRYVFAGAEKLRESTRRLWSENFGVRIFEGYGTTETAPILSLNTPMHNHPGSVGRLLPGIHSRLEPVAGISQGGRLLVSGPNVMLGYYLAANPGMIVPPAEGWHDTGDIVEINEEGYVFIKGRAKRFAKIGGEMISLTAVEEAINRLWPGYGHAVIQRPDAKKGEQIVLITTRQQADRSEIITYFSKNDLGELGIPQNILYIDKLPLLATGKIDYVLLHEWVQQPGTSPG